MTTPAEDPTSFGNLLYELNLITPEQIAKVVAFQAEQQPPLPFGEACVRLGLLDETLLNEILEQQQALRADATAKPALVAQRLTSATSRAEHLTSSLDSLAATAHEVLTKLR
jgi:hypothetical protein